jgi:hypothetical protein
MSADMSILSRFRNDSAESIMKNITFASSLLLCACASSGPTYYERQPWAQKGHDQASAECYTEINQRDGPPNYYLCMKAKGWFEVQACRSGLECRTER